MSISLQRYFKSPSLSEATRSSRDESCSDEAELLKLCDLLLYVPSDRLALCDFDRDCVRTELRSGSLAYSR